MMHQMGNGMMINQGALGTEESKDHLRDVTLTNAEDDINVDLGKELQSNIGHEMMQDDCENTISRFHEEENQINQTDDPI